MSKYGAIIIAIVRILPAIAIPEFFHAIPMQSLATLCSNHELSKHLARFVIPRVRA